MADIRKHSSTSNLIRFALKHATTGVGLTGLSSASSGLIISTIADNEATATTYTVAATNVETITTLGTFATPTASKCRFKEVDATNHKGLYEFQFADARFSVASAKRLVISVTGATNLLDADYEIQLVSFDPYDSVRMGMTALPNAAAEAAGGLYTRGTGAGQINQPANGMIDVNGVRHLGTAYATPTVAGVPEVDLTHVNGAAQTATLDTIKTETASIQTDTNDLQTQVGTAGAGLTDLGGMSTTMKAQVQTEAEDALVTHRLDELVNADSDIDGVAPPTVGSVFHELMSKTAGSFTFDQTTDSLEAVRDKETDIETDTAEIGVAGAGLTNINLPDQTMDITGNLSGSVGSVTGHTPQTGDTYALANGVNGFVAIKGDTAAILVDTGTTLDGRIPAALVGGRMDSNASAIDGNAAAAANLKQSTLGIVTAVVGAASTITSIVTSSMSPAAAVTDQFKGRIVTFAEDTTTVNLRGQSTDITGNTALGVLTVTALTTAPVSGDTFSVT